MQRSVLLALCLSLLLLGKAVASDEADIEAAEDEALEAEQEEASEDRTHFWWNDVTAESQWEFPAYEYIDPETEQVYWVHPETKETSWEKYPELEWDEVESEDGTGVFYFNSATNASQWEKPIVLAWRQVAVDSEEEGVQAPDDDKEEL